MITLTRRPRASRSNCKRPRRAYWLLALCIMTAYGMIALSFLTAEAQDRFANVEIKAEKLADQVHVLFGAGGNIGVLHGPDGVILIDDQFAPLTGRITAAVADISDQPIRFVINTHYHGDHTGGNENLGEAGAIIVAHDNVRQRLSEGAFIAAFDTRMEPQEGAALPVVTFAQGLSLHLNGDTIEAHHVPRGHTDGDTIIRFKAANVLHMGDTFFANRLPFIDVSGGGTIDGIINAARRGIDLANDDSKIIPGHGPVQTRADLMAYRDLLIMVRNRVAVMKDAGDTLDQVVANRSAILDGVPAQWLGSGDNADAWHQRFLGFVYESVVAR